MARVLGLTMTISLLLPTEPQLLRYRFRYTRKALVGEKSLATKALSRLKTPTQVNVFTSVSLWNKVRTITKRAAQVILIVAIVGAIVTLGTLVVPEIYSRVFPEKAADVLQQEPASPSQVALQPEVQVAAYQPPFDETLAKGTWISIPKIGVNTQAQATEDSTEALNTGVWLVPDFGRPGDTTQPVIMAAHRFGWKWWWKTDYWKRNSFYLLTETQPGDKIEVIYDQRKWTYEIYAGDEGDEITDYDADLILYTCKFMNSPIRYFRYAKLVKES